MNNVVAVEKKKKALPVDRLESQIAKFLSEMSDLGKRIVVVGNSIKAYIGYDPNGCVVAGKKMHVALDVETMKKIRVIFMKIAELFKLRLVAMQQTTGGMQMCCHYEVT